MGTKREKPCILGGVPILGKRNLSGDGLVVEEDFGMHLPLLFLNRRGKDT